jgi:hypothetical protein
MAQEHQDIFLLEELKMQVENMSKTQHIEILKIFLKYPKIKLNENKSGVYINLTFLPQEVVAEVGEYVKYILEQEKSLHQIEDQKQSFRDAFFVSE